MELTTHVRFNESEKAVFQACAPWISLASQIDSIDLKKWGGKLNHREIGGRTETTQEVAVRWAGKVQNGALSGESIDSLRVTYRLWTLIRLRAAVQWMQFAKLKKNMPHFADGIVASPKRTCEMMLEASSQAGHSIEALLAVVEQVNNTDLLLQLMH